MNANIVNIDISTPEKYYEYAKMVAETIHNIFKTEENIDLQNLINLIPPFKATLTIDNWFEASSKTELQIFKIKDLKYILSVNCKKITGKKSVLINRVWDIHHAVNKKDMDTKTKKKRKKSKKKDIISVDDSDDDEANIRRLIKNGINIYIKNNLITKEHKRKYRRTYITDNKWVFREYPNRYEYLGVLNKKRLVKTPIPPEIENYLMSI